MKKLIERGEGQHLDFKFEISDSRKIARSLVAFTNSEGGTLLIGVKDNGVVAGVRSEEEYYMVDAAANLYCRPSISFQTHEWTVEGRKVLEITILPDSETLHYAPDKDGNWKVYIRVDDHNLLANSIYLQARRRKKAIKGVFLAYTEKEKTLLHYLDENFSVTLSKFCRMANLSKYKAEKTLANLIALDIVEQILTENGCYYKLRDPNLEFPLNEKYPQGFKKW
ncbi:MAG: putative DNA binding domain-containing protein [Bacteroidales bacterium]|nr:putative DNA binding domain-containing protein [Bacteroidales bacterium]